VVGACLADHAWWPRLTDWAELWPRGRTLLLTDLQCADAHRALAALGPVSVHDLAADREADLAAAIQAVAIGRRWLGPGIVENLRDGRRPSLERKLSASQRVVLCLVGLLLDDREIARALAVSPEAVRQQCARIAGLLDLRGRARMIAAALRHGYVVHLPAGRSVPGLTHWLRGAGRAEARVR
jgi:DNA-binding NarL/FixJ family response regulator